MKILAFDTSNQALSVAIVEDNRILTEQLINVKRNHSIQLMPAIEVALQQSKLTLNEIDRIVVANGPGSYTGLRIAVTVAKSLAWAQNIKLVGISSLKALAGNSQATESDFIVPIFDARRNNVYTGLYQRNSEEKLEVVEPETHIAVEQYADYLASREGTFELIGEDAVQFWEVFVEKLGNRVKMAHPSLNVPRASVLALLARTADEIEAHELVPNYLKLAEAEENWLKENPDHKGDDWVEKV